MSPTFFPTPSHFRKWFEKNHLKETELYVGFYKVDSGKQSITWPQSVDEALCFGWIDGVRKSIDEHSYYIRFTPRKPGSIWSAINIKKIEELTKKGFMHPKGHEAFSHRKEAKSKIYSYEKAPAELAKEYEKKFKANKKACAFFHSLEPSYQRQCLHWVMDAKQEKTRISRLDELIRDSDAGHKIKRLSYGDKRK
jgi:uncharacterized protein YdeI (YjbR/CyaY-like superfamily)